MGSRPRFLAFPRPTRSDNIRARSPRNRSSVMCGIIGYVGHREAAPILIRGLRKLEYRGYDSSGVCTITPDGHLALTKAAGRIDELAARLKKKPSPGHIGIGHTRWATHGPATDENAHPHVGGHDLLAVVHNGVIENFRPLKERLEGEG